MLICHAAKCKMLYCKLNVTGILIIRLTLHVRQRQFSHGWPVLWTISTDLFKRIKFAINRIKILHSVMHNTNVLYYDVNRNSTARATRLTKRHLCRIVTCQRSSSRSFSYHRILTITNYAFQLKSSICSKWIQVWFSWASKSMNVKVKIQFFNICIMGSCFLS